MSDHDRERDVPGHGRLETSEIRWQMGFQRRDPKRLCRYEQPVSGNNFALDVLNDIHAFIHPGITVDQEGNLKIPTQFHESFFRIRVPLNIMQAEVDSLLQFLLGEKAGDAGAEGTRGHDIEVKYGCNFVTHASINRSTIETGSIFFLHSFTRCALSVKINIFHK